MEMIDRLNLILKKFELTPSEFADKIEVQRSSISHLTSGRNNPSLDFIIKTKQRFPEINTDWLIFGKGEMLNAIESPVQNLSNITPNLFDVLNEIDKIEQEKHSIKTEKIDSEIKKIVIFYKNGRFEDFSNE